MYNLCTRLVQQCIDCLLADFIQKLLPLVLHNWSQWSAAQVANGHLCATHQACGKRQVGLAVLALTSAAEMASVLPGHVGSTMSSALTHKGTPNDGILLIQTLPKTITLAVP